MSRSFYINGESMVAVKGTIGSQIIGQGLTQLGLTDSPIVVTPNFKHKDINVNAWGSDEVPTDLQSFMSDCNVRMTLVHFDPNVLVECSQLSLNANPGSAFGTMPRTGLTMGGNAARFGVGNNYIGLNILSPIAGVPWRFLYAYLTGPPFTWPLGTERSLVTLNWRAICYTNDPFGGGTAQPGTVAGTGSQGAILWDNTLDV